LDIFVRGLFADIYISIPIESKRKPMLNKGSVPPAFVLAAAVILLAGCGGGGGGTGGTGGTGGSSTNSQPIDITGAVENPQGAAASGAEVADSSDSLTTTTATSGAFSLDVPASDAGKTVIFDFYNTSGAIDVVQSINITAASGQTQNIGTIKLVSTIPVNPGRG